MYTGVSVFILGAGGRQALPVCKGFYDLGCKVTCFCRSKFDTGYMTKYATEKLLFEKVKSVDEEFYECGARLIRKNKYDLVVPLGDKAAAFLAQNKEELSAFSKIAVNDWNTFQYAIDKLKTMQVCQENGINAPRTIISDSPIADIEKGMINFPVVVKPRTGVGSVGFQIIRDLKSLEYFWSHYDNSNGPLLIQEYIEQGDNPQYRADLFRDRDGKFRLAMVGKVTRWYPIDGGSGVFAFTVHDEEIVDNCKRLLDSINWNGYANIDMVWDINDNCAKILEINGRTGATIKLDYIAGANISKLILENELGFPVTDMIQYPDNCRMTCLLPDLLWFVQSKNRFNSKPSWFNRKGVKDAIFSWQDPFPTIGFLITSLKGFKESMSKRKRL